MFTGLIETRGEVVAHQVMGVGSRLFIRAPFYQLEQGESIAVNGVCLTLLPDLEERLAFDLSPETLKLTTLGLLNVGDVVNLERAMLASTRFGGHYVSGHIDTKASLQSINVMDNYIEMTLGDFLVPAELYLVPKGSITLDGVSLTINAVVDGCISVMLVPHTLAVTTFRQWQEGQHVNVEFDYLTRVMAHQLKIFTGSTSNVTSQ